MPIFPNIFYVIGCLLLASAPFIWIINLAIDAVKTDQHLMVLFLANLAGCGLQVVLGFVFLGIDWLWSKISNH